MIIRAIALLAFVLCFAMPASAAPIDSFVGKWSQDGVIANCWKINNAQVNCRMNVNNSGRTYKYTLKLWYKNGKLKYGPDSKNRTYVFWLSGSHLRAQYNVTSGKGVWTLSK